MINFNNFAKLRKEVNEIHEYLELILKKEKTEKDKKKEQARKNLILNTKNSRSNNSFKEYELHIKDNISRVILTTNKNTKIDMYIDTDLILSPNFTHFMQLQMNN